MSAPRADVRRPSSRTSEILAQMVAMDTTSRVSNLDLVAVIEGLFDAHGIIHHRILSPDGTKANLVGQIGPDVAGGVVLSSHLDCVPVDGQPWTYEPFALTEDGGRYYGRGTSDMKGFLAVVLSALPAMAAAPLRRPIQFAFSYDEEIGTVGAPSAVEGLLANFPRPSAVLVGEPTLMEVVNAHKGVRAFEVAVDGLDGHSSQPHRAANAVAAITRVATYIDDLATTHREAAADPRFEPPYTTFNLGMISGGQALNIVPRRADMTFEYRPVPADDTSDISQDIARFARDEVLPRLRAATGIGDIRMEAVAHVRGLAPEVDGAAEALARRLSGYQGSGRTVPFGTDGGHFQAAALSTVVIGPGSIEQAHIPDEWIELEQLAKCEDFVDRLIGHLSD